MNFFLYYLLAAFLGAVSVSGFHVATRPAGVACRHNNNSNSCNHTRSTSSTRMFAKISEKRKQELGIGDGEDEYDLGKALENNTDPLISKIIAGSLILTIFGLLVVAIVIPATTDYGEGVCNALLTGGRC